MLINLSFHPESTRGSEINRGAYWGCFWAFLWWGVRSHNVWTNVMFGTVINLHSSFLTVSYGRLESPEGMWFSSCPLEALVSGAWGESVKTSSICFMVVKWQESGNFKVQQDANSGDIQKLTFYSVNMF